MVPLRKPPTPPPSLICLYNHLLSWDRDFTLCSLEPVFQKHCTYSLRWKSSKSLKASIWLKTSISHLEKKESDLGTTSACSSYNPSFRRCSILCFPELSTQERCNALNNLHHTLPHTVQGLELSWSSALALWPSLLLIWWPLDHQQVLPLPQTCSDVRNGALSRRALPCLGNGL